MNGPTPSFLRFCHTGTLWAFVLSEITVHGGKPGKNCVERLDWDSRPLDALQTQQPNDTNLELGLSIDS